MYFKCVVVYVMKMKFKYEFNVFFCLLRADIKMYNMRGCTTRKCFLDEAVFFLLRWDIVQMTYASVHTYIRVVGN